MATLHSGKGREGKGRKVVRMKPKIWNYGRTDCMTVEKPVLLILLCLLPFLPRKSCCAMQAKDSRSKTRKVILPELKESLFLISGKKRCVKMKILIKAEQSFFCECIKT